MRRLVPRPRSTRSPFGLRFNYPAAADTLELGLNDAATRAEAAYSLARLLELSGWEQEQIRPLAEQLVLPEVAGPQRQLLPSGNGTTLHPFEGWYRDRFAWARRPLREAGLA